MSRNYRVIIIGGGPAGLSAGLYTSRAKLHTLLIERGAMGGQIVNAEQIENYPGFSKGISGFELGQFMYQQATSYGLETLIAEVTSLKLQNKNKIVDTTEGSFTADAVILAAGSQRRKLGLPNEDRFIGKGVSFCATCDAPFFQNKAVAVVGGGDVALTEALALSKFASSVKLIHRRNQLRASKVLQERALVEGKIDILWNTIVREIEGKNAVKQLKLKQLKTDKIFTLEVAGIFIAIGLKPNTQFLKGILPLDEAGYIITNDVMETSIPSIFAAGDIRHNSARQAITAAGDGATAALSAEKFLNRI